MLRARGVRCTFGAIFKTRVVPWVKTRGSLSRATPSYQPACRDRHSLNSCGWMKGQSSRKGLEGNHWESDGSQDPFLLQTILGKFKTRQAGIIPPQPRRDDIDSCHRSYPVWGPYSGWTMESCKPQTTLGPIAHCWNDLGQFGLWPLKWW